MSDPILIVGAGPTGLTAALELSRFGIRVRIVDKLAEPFGTSRAIGVQARTLELLEKRSLSEEMVRLGNPGLAGSVYGGGARVFRLDFTQIDSRYDYAITLDAPRAAFQVFSIRHPTFRRDVIRASRLICGINTSPVNRAEPGHPLLGQPPRLGQAMITLLSKASNPVRSRQNTRT